ncbi:unnamed protein product [Candida verbasci]|uniref:Nuclear distribution protein PAC1 n=1 Tax=Candida verbasci TaxID=1227364 RepID=A0A9W4TWL9_9ASCO|nr:unnamed protein product [Candida verbasci]
MEKNQILTERQQLELNKAIIQYLEPQLAEDELSQLSSILIPQGQADSEIVDNYLEKKWSTVLRLQKKIIDLENELQNLKTIVKQLNIDDDPNSIKLTEKINWCPLTVKKSFKTTSAINSVEFHPNLPFIISGNFDGSIYIYNLQNDEYQDDSIPEKLIKAHSRSINKITWSDQPLQINKLNKCHVLATCSSDLSIKIWDENFKHIRTLSGHEHTVSSLKFSTKNPSYLYSVSRDKTVKIWDVINGLCIKSFVGHSEWVRDVDVVSSEFGDFILTCSNDQSARLSHDSGTGIVLMIGHSHVIESVKFLPSHSNKIIDEYITNNIEKFPTLPVDLIKDEIYRKLEFKYCITGGRDNVIKLWLLPPPVLTPHQSPLPSKYNQSQAYLISDLIGHVSWVKSMIIHPNGRFTISCGDDKTIKIWDIQKLNESGKVEAIRTLKGHEGFINDIKFAKLKPKEKKENTEEEEEMNMDTFLKDVEKRMRFLFSSGSSDNTIRLWS